MENFPDELDYDSISWKEYVSMKPNSGVVNFSVLPNSIWVEFQQKKVYLYRVNDSVTEREIAEMKLKAERGHGLSGFISTHPHIKKGYAVGYEWRDGAYRKLKRL